MAYGGNDTPITSDDEDDDQVIGNNETLGGSNFVETHDNATPISDNGSDEDDDIMQNNNGNNNNNYNDNERNVVQVYFEGNLIEFEIQSSHETLGDLRQRINNREDDLIKMSDCHYFSLPQTDENGGIYDNNDEDEEELRASGRLLSSTEKLCDYKGNILSIYWKSFDLLIMDGMDLSLNLRVSQDWKIKKVKDEIELNHSVRLQCLSWQGMELQDQRDLQYYEIMKSGFTLISRISISIEDHTCEIATDLLVCDFWDFDKVLTTYLDTERRMQHENAAFYYSGKKLAMNESVFAQQLHNRSKLEYKVEAYPINIYDSESALNQSIQSGINGGDMNAFTLMVYDQWTLNDVKKAYSKATKKPFMEKEKFLSQERELEDNVPLWKLRIRDNEKLIIEREQQEVSVCYICCECGSEVKLRRYDSVQCRQCFHGAVYKQRTTRVCQYSCR